MAKNPFRVAELARGPYFTGRENELRVLVERMRSGGRVLVRGPRRMGKSSLMAAAGAQVVAAGGVVLAVDLGTITTVAEAADRVLAGLSGVEAWRDRLSSWASSLAPQVVLGWDAPDRPRLAVAVGSWPRSGEGERALLAAVLGVLGEAGGAGGEVSGEASGSAVPVVVVLDDIERLMALGGARVGGLLRAAMAGSGAAWVCAVSDSGGAGVAGASFESPGASAGFFDTVAVGPLDDALLGAWIDERMRGSGVASNGVGAAVVARAGPRTQDVLQVASALWYRAALRGRARVSDVEPAIAEIVRGGDPAFRRTWQDLTPVQQRVLRAVGAGAQQLFGTATRERFRLGPASSVGTAVDTLTARHVLDREDDVVVFDSPFFRAWVQAHT